jgi:hypothetical protein
MAGKNDDAFEDDDDEAGEDVEQLRQSFFEHISDFVEENDLEEEFVAAMLLDMAVTTRMVAYTLEDEEPTIPGLKQHLDAFQREAQDLITRFKEGAEEFIAHAKQARAEAQAEEDDED